MALTTTNLIDWINNLNLTPEDLVDILVGTGVEVIDSSIKITQLPSDDNTDSLTVSNNITITDEDTPVTTVVLDSSTNTLLTYPLTLNITESSHNGTATVNNDGTINYIPNLDFYGYDSYTYSIDDGNGGINSATVNLQVNPDSAVDDFATTDEDTPITIAVSDNDLELDEDRYPYTVSIANDAANGTAIVNADDTITYTPNPDFYGTDSYTYAIDDGNGGTRLTTVSVWVNPNSFVDDVFLTDQDTPVIIGVLNNDALSVTVTTDSDNGTTTVNPDGTITYTPDPNFYGTDNYTYTIDDGNGETRSRTVLVTVRPKDTLVDDFFITNENNSLTSAVIDKIRFTIEDLNKDQSVNADGNLLSTNNALVTVNRDNTLTYVPNPDFNGVDSYNYTIHYENGLTSSASVLLTVNPVNDEPEPGDDLVITDEDTPVTTVVLDNDIDRDNADSTNSPGSEEGNIELDPTLAAYQAIGYFEGGISEDIGIESGIILSSGDISEISGPNDSDTTGDGLGTPGDLDLDLILNPNLLDDTEDREEVEGDTNDAVALEFDFIPDHEEFVFEYVFASEEYNEFANSIYNDIFAFLLDGENIALIPGTNTPVSINNINAQENTSFFRNNDLDDVGVDELIATEFDGLTTVLGVRGFVTPGQTHHLKLVIADAGDATYDSAVFLQEGSLSTPPVIPDATLTVNERDIVTIGGSVTPALAKLKFTLLGTNTHSINEVGIFEVDDDFGTIEGVLPGSPDYQQLALGRITSRSIFTALPDSIIDGQDLTRLINYNVDSKVGFYLIAGGTTDMLLSNTPLYFHNPTPQLLYSFPEANANFQDPLKITNNGNSLNLAWESDFLDNDYDDLVLSVEVADSSTIPTSALSSRRQGDLQKEIVDLSILEDGKTITANINVWSESEHHNWVGLYRLENAQGAVFDSVTEQILTPDQNGYLAAAIRQRVFEFDSSNGDAIELEKGYYAPYIIVGATADEWLNSNPTNFYAQDSFAYVPFIDADSTGQTNYDRVTLLADNIFAFEEELIAETDFDFNDIIMEVDLVQNNNNTSTLGNIIIDNTLAVKLDTNNNYLLNKPINRFRNSKIPGTYLYAGEAESQNIRENFPNLIEEGQAFKVADGPADDLIYLNRFRNSNAPGTYLYAGEAESQNIRENFPNFIEEGIAFYIYDGAANRGVDVYRLQNQNIPGTYIFVTAEERQNILANSSNFIDEGVAFEAEI
ncbi:MAG: choice-of-anchor L domain-containing protein [Xenococcus sp. (in: cyanobacteria)]